MIMGKGQKRIIGKGAQFAAAAMVTFGLSAASWAASVTELVSWSTINGSGTSTSDFAAAIDGDSAYFILNSTPSIVRIDNINGSQTRTELVTSAAWNTVSGGKTNITGFYGFGVAGNYARFADTASSAIYQVDKSTGAISVYLASNDTVATLGSAAKLNAAHTTLSSGEVLYWDSTLKAMYVTTSAHHVSNAVSASVFSAAGITSITSGLTVDATGNIYFGTANGLYEYTTGGNLNLVVAKTAITSGSLSFRDVFAAPDGNVYFVNNTTPNIWVYDPDQGVDSAKIYMSNGDMGAYASVYQLGWYNDQLVWNVSGTNGLFTAAAVPEPAGLTFLGLGLFLLLTRPKRA